MQKLNMVDADVPLCQLPDRPRFAVTVLVMASASWPAAHTRSRVLHAAAWMI